MKNIILFAIALSFLACSNSEKTPNTSVLKVASEVKNCLAIQLFEGTYPTSESSGVELTSIKIEGDCLVMDVNYHGCKNTKFELFWNKMVKKSSPAQTSLYLKKTEVGGHCHENNVQVLNFDLEMFKKKNYGGKISLNVSGSNKGILYEYKL